MIRGTASALTRLMACPGSGALPQANTTSQAAEDGVDRHAEQQEAVDQGDLSVMPERIRKLIPADATSVRSEVAVALDVVTGVGRELGTKGRDYSGCKPNEIAGTADLVVLAPGRALVADYKGFEEVDEPAENAQVLLYAAAIASAHGCDEVTVAIAYLGTGRVLIATIDVIELHAHVERLRAMRDDVAEQQARYARGVMPDVAEGPWCRYCPSAHVCPAKVALLNRLSSGAEGDQLLLMLPLDDDKVRIALTRIATAKAILKRIETAIYAYASDHTIDLGDGRFFGPHRTTGKEKLDGPTVYAVARDLYGRDFADTAIVIAATKARIKEAAKGLTGAGSVAAIERKILDEVRARGGASKTSGEDVGEYDDPSLAVVPERRVLGGTG